MTGNPRALRELGQAARQVNDAQLLKLVAVLDQQQERGATDAVLDPVRARLGHLRPGRPLNLARLLFVPLDSVLVAPRDWRTGQWQVPRTAIMPMLEALRAAEPALLARTEAALTGRTTRDLSLIAQLGGELWQAAEVAFKEPPADWSEAGIPRQSFEEIAQTSTTLWRHAAALWLLRQSGDEGPPESMVRSIFRIIAADGPDAVSLALLAVLPHASEPASMIAIVAGIDRALGPAGERALDRYLAGVQPDFAAGNLASTAAVAARFASILDDLDSSVSRDKPRRAQALQALRLTAATACTERLKAEVEARLLAPLAAAFVAPLVSDAEVADLESTATALRGINESGRRLHASAGAEKEMHTALAVLIREAPRLPETGPGFCRPDALRLLEILAGTGAALRLAPG